jgi:hypothetical protein
MQPLSLYPANSLFVEGYLTTRGDAVEDTYAMIRDAGFEIEGNDAYDEASRSRSNERAKGDATHGGVSQFRIPGGGNELLKPEIIRA